MLGIDGAEKLPAVRWKMRNLGRMPDDKHRAALESLERVLEGQRGSARAG
jgi:hypothetical protein